MEILFINANKGLSKKEEESQNSYARSHAARVAAARIASARTKAQVNAKRGPVFKSVTRKHAVVPSDHLPLASSEAVVRHVVGYKALTEPPVYPGFGSFRGELFDILPSGTHIEDLRALDFFTQVTLPDMDVVNEMFDQLSLSGQFLPCLDHPVGVHAFLAMVHVTNAMQLQSKTIFGVLALEHRGLALNEVRKLVNANGHLTELLLTVMSVLATLEVALGHRESYQIHIAAMQRLFREKGHLKLPSGQRLKDLQGLYSDTTFAMRTGRSNFDRRPYDATPFTEFPATMKIRLPQGFTDILALVPICQDTADLFINAYKLGVHVPCVRLTPEQKFRMAQNRQKKRKHYNWLDAVPIVLEPDRPEILFEKMLVLALSLFAWCGFSNLRYPHFGMFNQMMTQLVERLNRHSEPETVAERNCLAWMWLMAIDAWRTGNSQSGHVLFGGLVAMQQFLGRFKEYRSWSSVRPLTRLFFWNDNMEDFWTRNWDRLVLQLG